MTEKSFAATPFICRDEILDVHIFTQPGIENCIMASYQIRSKLKDFEGIHVPAYENKLHFSG